VSREIKFRARNAELPPCWIYGYFVNANDCCYMVNDTGRFKVVAGTECQFTGLHDRNGREIYEGDIVRTLICFGPAGEEYRNIAVKYDNLGQISIQLWVFNDKRVHWPEVIGNIHEHPHMLEEVH